MLIPYEIETLEQERPWMNWLIVALCSLTSLGAWFGLIPESLLDALVLYGWKPVGLFGHVLLHADILHLIGNMVFLWVFGNALCANISNKLYLPVFLLCALCSAGIHNAVSGSMVIGASGAINGVVGFVLAMYPLNRISVFWFFVVRGGTFTCRAWLIILLWLAFDLWGVMTGGQHIAYWAHIGGLLGGTGFGLLFLQIGWIYTTDADNRTLLEIIKRQYPENA